MDEKEAHERRGSTAENNVNQQDIGFSDEELDAAIRSNQPQAPAIYDEQGQSIAHTPASVREKVGHKPLWGGSQLQVIQQYDGDVSKFANISIQLHGEFQL
jgi:hypothetical protein